MRNASSSNSWVKSWWLKMKFALTFDCNITYKRQSEKYVVLCLFTNHVIHK